MMPSNELINQLVKEASEQSPLAKNYADHVSKRTEKMRVDIANLAKTLQVHQDEFTDTSGKGLKNVVHNFIDQELININNFDAARKQKDAPWLPFPISTNKLGYILPKVKERFSGEDGDNEVVRVFQGEFKPDDSFFVKYPLLRTNSYFGSNRATLDAAAMFCVRFATSSESMANYAATDSSIAHVTPCKELPEVFVKSGSKFYMDWNGTPGFAVPHGGYAFGGQRNQPNQKEFGFEDCSSILDNFLHQTYLSEENKYSPAPNQFSTSHLLYAWRDRQKEKEKFKIDTSVNNYDAKAQKYYAQILDLDNPTIENVAAGDIYLQRTFNLANGDPDKNATGGGHTGIVVNRHPGDPTQILMLEMARDMEIENKEKDTWGVAGAGIGIFSGLYEEQMSADKIRRTMFLSPKKAKS